MKTRPIIFSAESVRAILAGRKTQTRRVVKFDALGRVCRGGYAVYIRDGVGLVWTPYAGAKEEPLPSPRVPEFCPFGAPGDQLWVRETWWQAEKPGEGVGVPFVYYDAEQQGGPDLVGPSREWDCSTAPGRWGRRSPIHMPRWASRLTLEVSAVRVEQLQGISEADAIAEGIQHEALPPDPDNFHPPGSYGYVSGLHPFPDGVLHVTAVGAFEELWDALNAKRGFGWDANPFCWVLDFEVAR